MRRSPSRVSPLSIGVLSVAAMGCPLLTSLAPLADKGRRRESQMGIEFVDADAHVVEAELAPQCLQRWPEEFTFDAENRQIRTEGRRYPEFEGPGAGCPPEHGLSTAPGINPYSPEGTLADADKDGIAVMV